MLRSLYSGVSGLRNHQVKMDVIGNNIANVNTYGFKYGRALFQDVFSQTVRSASAPGTAAGGTNPAQVGLGISVAAIDTVFTQGGAAGTERPLDLMLDGEGFFCVRLNNDLFYTRSGNFYQDANGDLLDAQGKHLQGFMGPIIDSQTGAELTNGFADLPDLPDGSTFDSKYPGYTVTAIDFTDPAWKDTFNPSTDLMNLTIPNCFTGITIGQNGEISARYVGDGKMYQLGKIATATVVNPGGMTKVGNNLYRDTLNSGAPQFEFPNTIGHGGLVSGYLEMSNVDLARETTEMIITQRGFQANSRIITVSDTLLEELVNLKR